MKDTDFTYSVAYMRTMENGMLGQGDIDTLLTLSNVGDATKYLMDRNYGSGDKFDVEGKKEIDSLLKSELEKAWSEVRAVCPKGAPIDVLLYQNDFQNLKTILKAVFENTAWEQLMLYPSIVEPEVIHQAVSENKYDDMPSLLRKPAEEAYEALAKLGDGQKAEIILDKACFKAMESIANKEKNQFLQAWVDLWAVLANMKTMIRSAHAGKDRAFIENAILPMKQMDTEPMVEAAAQGISAVYDWMGSNGYQEAAEAAQRSISEFEKWSDNRLMEFIQSVKNNTFGFEPLLAFLFGKKAEIQSVRIVLYGLLNHIPKETIKERLRDMYV
ncbi:V-type ATPase subunit [Christensenellaceae bacterium OttesenSCG-928-K19]|nr:V-type ATPase subunit [Christensenellaceae bacterium OttesenSCG-928-K19]